MRLSVKDIFDAKVGTPVDLGALAHILKTNSAQVVVNDATPSDWGGLDGCPPASVHIRYGDMRTTIAGHNPTITNALHTIAGRILGLT